MRMIENNRINPASLTTHRFKFEEAAEAFDLMYSKKDNVIKPVVFFD